MSTRKRAELGVYSFDEEIREGSRFSFGKNWWRFLEEIDDTRIAVAEKSLKDVLGMERLDGKTFLDIGCGSGLFSLAARRLGAEVCSFDYDPLSVECAFSLRERFFPCDGRWTIHRGSVLDDYFMASVGEYDIVYSWGVLHHTGSMWEALGKAVRHVRQGGWFCVAVYNDQGWLSRYWLMVKRIYCSSWAGGILVSSFFYPFFIARGVVADVLRGRNPLKRDLCYKTQRGMSLLRNIQDWLGGLPFEVAKPEEVLVFCNQRGLVLIKLCTAGRGHGNNEFVFRRQEAEG